MCHLPEGLGSTKLRGIGVSRGRLLGSTGIFSLKVALSDTRLLRCLRLARRSLLAVGEVFVGRRLVGIDFVVLVATEGDGVFSIILSILQKCSSVGLRRLNFVVLVPPVQNFSIFFHHHRSRAQWEQCKM